MILSRPNLKYLFVICVVAFSGYVLGAREVGAHRASWQLSPRFATCEEAVNYLNLEGIHEEFQVIPDTSGGYRIIFED